MGDALPGHYEVLDQIGTGGTAAVHRARDRRTGVIVALKILRGVSAVDARQLEREAAVLGKLEHDHVVRYVEHGRTGDGELYLVMPWIDGEPLSARLARQRLTIDEVMALARPLVVALEAAHRAGVVHRDLKPANVLLAGGSLSQPVLIDFGLAKLSTASLSLTRSGVVIGTPAYMAPEQARSSGDVDGRADMFALGCILFECLTGTPPFVAEHVWATLAKVLFDEPASVREARPDTPPEVETLIERLLAKDPAQRPSASEALAMLDVALSPAAATRAPVRQFASAEKRLISAVVVGVAGPDDDIAGDGETLVPGDASPVSGVTLMRVRATSGPFGALVERLAGGHIVAILRGQGSAADRVAHAARCALAIRRDVSDAPVVLATGSAVVDGRLPVGAVIDHAARLLRAPLVPGSDGALPVLLDPVSAGLLDGRFEVTQRGALTELWRERATAVPVRTLLGRPAPFVGRERELLMLESVIAEVTAESVARAVLVTAEPGIGKSRLRHEFVTRLGQRGLLERTWLDRGDPTSAGAPFGMIERAVRRGHGLGDSAGAEELRRRLSELAAGEGDPVEQGERVERAFTAFVEEGARRGPLLFVLDDLHWGDLPSMRLLEATLVALADRPIALVGFARPEIHARFPDLWTRLGCARWPLAELSRRASERMIREVVPHAGDEEIATVVERAAGNAFLLEELIRCVAEGKRELPATALAVVEARLDALDADRRRVLRAASVFGNSFWRGAVQHVLGGGTAASEIDRCLAGLATAELVTARPESRIGGDAEYAFRHVLVREAAYASLADDDRTSGHAAAGEWLATHGETSAMVLAGHFDRGGLAERAAAAYLRAASEALAGHDYAAVHDRVARGRNLTRDAHLDGLLLLTDGEAHRWTGAYLDAVAVSRQAIARFEVGDEVWVRAVAQTGLNAALYKDFTQAEDIARVLCAHVPRASCRARWMIACATLAARLVIAGRLAWGRRLLDATGDAAPDDGPAVVAWLARARGVDALRVGDLSRAAELMRTSADAFAEAGDERNATIQRLNQAECLVELGAFDRAHAIAIAHLDSRLSPTIVAHARSALAKLAVFADRPFLLGLIGIPPDDAGPAAALLLLDLAEGHRRAGALEQAETLITRALDELEPYPTTRAAALAVQALILIDRGRAADAAVLAERAFSSTSAESAEQRRMQIVLAYVRALEASGRRAAAADHADLGRRELEAQAALIVDPELRSSFLRDVSIHRELLAAAERLGV